MAKGKKTTSEFDCAGFLVTAFTNPLSGFIGTFSDVSDGKTMDCQGLVRVSFGLNFRSFFLCFRIEKKERIEKIQFS